MNIKHAYTAGRVLKGVALLFLAMHLMFTSIIQIHYLSQLDFQPEAVDAINLWYELMLLPIAIFAVWGLWSLIGPTVLELISPKTNLGEADE